MMRISIILGVLAIILGVLLTVGAGFPSVAKVLATPFCEDIDETNMGMTLTCENGDSEQDLTMIFIFGGTAVIILGTMIIVFGLVGSLMAKSAKLDRIIRTGEAAQGLILDMQHTGVRVNQQPMIKFRLQVTPSYDPPYEAETDRIIPFGMMGRLAIGMTVPVKYDPQKPTDVALDFQAMQLSPISFGTPVQSYTQAASFGSAPAQSSLSDKLRELEDSYKAGLITQAEYEAARQKIISGV